MTVKSEEATVELNSGAQSTQPTNLYASVRTYDGKDGKTIGDRIVDMYHYGTSSWLTKHHWWAMHNGHTVETELASEADIDAYIAKGGQALQAKFNKASVAA